MCASQRATTDDITREELQEELQGAGGRSSLQHGAVAMLLALASAEQGRPRGVLEDFADTLAGLGGAFEVVLCADLLRDGHALREERVYVSKSNEA